MKNVKKFLAIPAMAVCLFITACSSGPNNNASMYDLQKAMLEADSDFPPMITVGSSDENADELFVYLSDMDFDKVDAFFLGYSSEGLADEVAVIRVKNSGDLDDAVKSLNAHKEGRVHLYETYDPTQTSRAEAGLVFKNGNYAVLIISDNSSAVKKAFEDGIQ